jgi:AraC-like DNA-binding protein
MKPIWKETTIDGARTRRWSLDAKQCPELKAVQISWLGIEQVYAPYRRVRLAPSGSYFLGTIEGEGRVWLEGRWQWARPGSLWLAPPGVLNAFHAAPGRPWKIAWVRYEEARGTKPVVGAGSPLRLAQGGAELARVLGGLREEWEGERAPDLLLHWIGLVHGIALRRARPWRSVSRVGELWTKVAQTLATPWKLTSLAAAGGVSTEHLRRLCRQELGRTPMEHVTYMRVQRAQELLVASGDKLEAIAPLVGYRSAEVFSRAFVRCTGLTPSAYRAASGRREGVRKEGR